MKKIRLSLIPILMLFFVSVQGQSITYVDVDAAGAHDGTSWTDAYDNIQTAIDNSQAGDTLWVKKGTYKPTKDLVSGPMSLSQRGRTFILKSNISIYGGFQGTESSLNQRVLNTTDLTILSGELSPTDSSKNLYHVVAGIDVKNITLNGLSIRDGNANSVGEDKVGGRKHKKSYGGGIYLDAAASITLEDIELKNNYSRDGGAGLNLNNCSKVKIHNALFTSNVIDTRGVSDDDNPEDGGAGLRSSESSYSISGAHFTANKCYNCQGGGAMRNIKSNPSIDSSSFTSNFVDGGDGGAAVYNAESNPTFTTVSFDTNTTKQEGGAVYSDESHPIFNDVTFTANSSGDGGGGAMENDAGEATLNNVVFKDNSSLGDGGAIQNYKSDIYLTDVTFENNKSVKNGGAIVNYTKCSPTMLRVIFKGNKSDGDGGAIHSSKDCEVIITNSLFYNNHAGHNGGAIYTELYTNWEGDAPSSVILTNVTITKNRADSLGGGGFDDGTGDSKLRNSIIYGNYAYTDDDMAAPSSMITTSMNHTIIGNDRFTDGQTLPTPFTNLVFKDSLNNDFRLHSTSPAIDNGDGSVYDASATPDLSAITTDIIGADRIMGDDIDLGAYEFCASTITATSTIGFIQTGNKLTFTATPNSSGLNPTYQWFINNVAVAGETADMYVATAGVDIFNDDWIMVATYSTEPCVITGGQDSLQMVLVGLNDVKKAENKLNVYPNPNNGTFTLDYSAESEGVLSYTITDITGRELYREEGQSNTDNFEKVFNLDLSDGLYFFTVINNKGEKQSLKFMVGQ